MIKRFYILFLLGACLGFTSNAVNSSSFGNRLTSFPAIEVISISEPTPDDDSKFNLFISQGVLTIKYGKPTELIKGEVIVYNLLGQEITRKKLENSVVNLVSIPIQNTCYLVRINYSAKVHTQKVMISVQ